MHFRLRLGFQRSLLVLSLCIGVVDAAGSPRAIAVEMIRHNNELRNTYLIIGLLGLIVVSGSVFFLRSARLNRRLKHSEALVKQQNLELQTVGEALRRAKERAETASRLKSDFIQNMTHEVRTPLNSIVGFSQVLASQFRNDPATREYASIIETNSMSLLRLIDDVLDVSVLDQVEALSREETCELNGCCRECTDKMLRQVRPGVAMIFESSTLNPSVRTNSRRVMQVLLQLLHNAAKFTDRGEIILNYTCLQSERLLRFTVSDTGPGVPPSMQERVFERFVKLDTFSQGTGLGLPVCRMIAERLGGRLCFDPEYTRGCRAIFEIPYEPAS